MLSRRTSARLLSSLAIAALLASPFAQAQADERVNVRFSWKLKGEYAAFYVAKEKGYFTQEGLDVKLGEGAGAPAALGALIQEQEDVVVLPGAYALTAISKGMPVKLIALYHPVAPLGLLSHPDDPVRTPKDLEGKTVATSPGDTVVEYLPLLCKRNGVDCDKIRRVRGDMSMRVSQLRAKQVDVAGTYLNVEPPILEAQDVKVAIFDATKYGMVVPGLSLVSSNKSIDAKRETLRKFVRALNKGFDAARANPDEAASMLLKNWPGGPPHSVVAAQVKKTLEFTPAAAPARPLGAIDEALIKTSLSDMVELKMIDAPPKPLTDYFTNVAVQ